MSGHLNDTDKAKIVPPLAADDDFNIPEAFPEGAPATPTTFERTLPEMLSPQAFTKKYTKLEVVNARQIESLLFIQYVIITIGALYTLTMVILFNTILFKRLVTSKEEGWEFDFRANKAPFWVFLIDYSGQVVLFFCALILAMIYTLRILSLRFQVITHEQIWTVFLLASVAVYLVPLRPLVAIHDRFLRSLYGGGQWASTNWWKILDPIGQVLFASGFSICTIFYPWACAHSYRFLESKIGFRFYLPKLLPLAVYVGTKVVLLYSKNRIETAELPIANFTGMVSLYYTADRWDIVGVWSSIALTVADLLFIVFILYELRRTKMVLKKADYVKYRSKQIGFRFFLYHNITFYSIYIVFYVLLQLSMPNGGAVMLYIGYNRPRTVWRSGSMVLGLHLMLIAYAWTEAYVNLPADALGFRGWFTAQSPRGFGADSSELEPITYRKREPPSLHGVVSDMNINCFIMQTHVTMFNFAWLVYYWDTSKVENFKITQDVFKFTIADYIKDKETDTHVLIVDGADRIVVAFKGTTSMKNIKTDVNMFHTPLRLLLPTPIPDEEDDTAPAAHEAISSRQYRRAQVHQGFATAYRAVAPRLLSVLRKLVEKKRRPVFITGHSLGGALATICSLDLLLALGLTRREIFVSTFGAPRVGSRSFRELYDGAVPIHWRMVVGPDVVAKLPKMGYVHCGKKILITVDGDLFMDPNSLELNLWSGDTASILYHRKASYLLAMRAWCEKHHGDEYVPEFWPFPVSKDDTKRFEHAMTKSEFSGGRKTKNQANKRDRLVAYDSMIDQIGEAKAGWQPRSAHNWARLTQKLMQANMSGAKEQDAMV